MGRTARVLQRLDDLDTRVLGRGDPDWRRPKTEPWTPVKHSPFD